jgi:hypothetical protein
VCARWRKSFASFFNDMGMRPAGTTLERCRNDGNYTPKNCIWATPRQQSNNQRTNRLITLHGTTHTLAEWCRIKSIRYHLVYGRLVNGWTELDAVCCPLGISGKPHPSSLSVRRPLDA